MEPRVRIVDLEDVPAVARALDSPVRRRMLEMLFERPLTVSRLAKALGIPQSTCTVNLQVLKEAKLVRASVESARLLVTSFEEVVIPLRGAQTAPDTELDGNRHADRAVLGV